MKVILKEEVLLRDFRDALLSKLKTHFMDNELYLSNKKKGTNKQTKIKQEKKKREAKGV